MKILSKALFGLYLLILIWLVLFKLSFNFSWVLAYQTRSLNLIPFAHFSPSNLRGMIYNFAVFIPFGLLLCVNFKRATFWRRLAFIFMFSLAAEIIQFVFAIGVTDITDIIMNTSGGILGLILYDLSKKYVENEKLDRYIVVAAAILLIVFILLLDILFSRNVQYHSPPHKTHQAVTRYFEISKLQRPHQTCNYHIPAA